jgi:hypothetical protein
MIGSYSVEIGYIKYVIGDKGMESKITRNRSKIVPVADLFGGEKTWEYHKRTFVVGLSRWIILIT